MKVGVVVKQLKPEYGPIADAIKKTGVDILSLENQSRFPDYDHLIVFYNKVPEIRQRPKGKIVWWMNDLRLPTELPPVSSFNFDEIFICHRGFDEQYKTFFNKPIHYMPQCGHSYDIIKGRKIDWDVSFIGKVDGKKFYHRDRGGLMSEIKRHRRLGIISGEGQTKDQAWIYNQTRYNLAVSFPMIEGTSNRLYNILASKGFALVRYFPGLEKQFKNREHLVWFKTIDEAITLMNYYDKHEDEYQAIKEQGHKQYLLKHTASCRLNNILDIVLGKEINFKGYL